MTTLLSGGVVGVQRPRVLHLPADVAATSGAEAAELAALAGLHLDDWQRYALDVMLAEQSDGQWSAFECGVNVPRQNGKGGLIEARELAGLFLLDETLLLHTAHEFKTSIEAFRRLRSLVTNCDDLRRKVHKVRESHADVEIELLPRYGGGRVRFVARSKGSGRGFTGDCVILDEAMILGPEQMAALLPTLSARPNPQLLYFGSAPLATSQQWHAVRKRALAGDSPRLAYLEWSVDDGADPADPQAWATANPALGVRISYKFVRGELDAMPPAEFARERLGVPDMPAAELAVIPLQVWADLHDEASEIAGPVVFAVEVAEDRRWASIAAAGRRADGLVHVELVARAAGTRWVRGWLDQRCETHRPAAVVVSKGGPAGSLVADLEHLPGFTALGTADYAAACGAFYDAVLDEVPSVRHRGADALEDAVGLALVAAQKRATGDAWVWDRRSGQDISPLVAVTLAHHGVATQPPSRDPMTAVW